MPTNCLKVTSYTENLPPPPPAPSGGVGSNMTRCSSVDELCSLPPVAPKHYQTLKTYSLQHGSRPPTSKQYQNHNRSSYHQKYSDSISTSSGYGMTPPSSIYSYNNNNSSHHYNNNDKNDTNPYQPPVTQRDFARAPTTTDSHKVKIQLVGGGYGFLPPSKFVASEPVYSDASTPVAIRRRSSISAVEPETPAYERSAASFSTFTEPQLPRAVLRGTSNLQQALSTHIPGKAMTVGAQVYRNNRQVHLDSKHATITGAALPKGFHQPTHVDSRYFSVPAVKHQGTTSSRVHPTPQQSTFFAPTQ